METQKSAGMLRLMRDRWSAAAIAAIEQRHFKQAILMVLKAHKLDMELTDQKEQNQRENGG